MYFRRNHTLSIIIAAVAVIVLLCVIGALTSGFTNWKPEEIKESLEKQRNPGNLITLDEITLKSGKDASSDVEIKVDELGAVKLSGEVSANDSITYATVQLPAGTYKLTGCSEGTLKTFYMTIEDASGDTVVRSDSDQVLTVSATGTYSVIIHVKEGATLWNEKLLPVLCPSTSDVGFYAD